MGRFFFAEAAALPLRESEKLSRPLCSLFSMKQNSIVILAGRFGR